MADAAIAIAWTGKDLVFEAPLASGQTFRLDGDGVRAYSPVQALLLSLAGCTAADIIDIVTKMRLEPAALTVEVEGDRNAEPPRYFKAIRLRYLLRGVSQEDEAKVQRAIALSQEKYCSVLHSLRPDLVLSSELVLG